MLIRATRSASPAQIRELNAESRHRVCLISQRAPDPEAVLEAPEYLEIWSGGSGAVSVNGVWRSVTADRLMVARPGARVQLRLDPASRRPVSVVAVPAPRIQVCLEHLSDVTHRFRRLVGDPEPLAGISERILCRTPALARSSPTWNRPPPWASRIPHG